MPVFKAKEYIYQAVQGVLSQTYTNLELIIIDDNNDDGCYVRINEINDKRIRYYKGKKQGLAGARNYGVELSKGTYIANMDADDVYNNQRIEKQINYLLENKIQICGTWMSYFGNYNNRFLKNPIKDIDIKFCMLFSSPIANPTVLGLADLFKSNLYINSVAEDYDLWARLAIQGVKFGNIPEVLTGYRIHNDQTSNTKYSKMISDSIKVADFYSLNYNDDVSHEVLKKYNYIFNEKYNIEEINDLAKILIEIGVKNNISQDAILNALCNCFIKLDKPGFKSLMIYYKYLNKCNISIFKKKNINILMQSIFSLKRGTFLFNALKKIAF